MTSKPVRERLLASSMICGAAFLGLSATQAQAQAAGETTVSEIVVTGSRIPRPNLEAPTPIVTIAPERLQSTGALEVGAVLRDLPSSGVAFGTPSTTGGLVTTSFGLSSFNLRNLGENRTLILVDGRRFVSSVPGQNIVDLNNIPPEMVDRIDVVTGGASAVYGSDALAGVINVITKKNFEGLQVNGQAGISNYHDNEQFKFSVTGGSSFADDKGHALLSLSWGKENGAFARNRSFLRTDSVAALAVGAADTNDYKSIVEPFFSSYSLTGRANIPCTLADQDLCPGPQVLDGQGGIRDFDIDVDGFNRQQFRALAAPIDRYTVAGKFDYQINPSIQWFADVNYISTRAHTGGEPFPLDSYNVYGGNNSSNTEQCVDTNGDGTPDQCIFGIPLTSASVPEVIKNAVRAANPGLTDEQLVVGFRKRTLELGPRNGEALRQTFRVSTGLRGDITPVKDLHYEVSLTYGRTTSHEETGGQLNVLNFRNALNTEIGPGGVEQCVDPSARLEGCVPLHLFGVNAISPEAADYVRVNSTRDAVIEQTVLNGFVNGTAWELPAGPLQYVAGAEYREEQASDVPDPLFQRGLNASNITPATTGSFHVYEAFGELNVPLLRDMPFAKQLDMHLAARFSNYSTVGNTKAYAVSFEYTPIEQLRLRTQYARAVRAPNINELFQGPTQDFPSVIDPCSGVTVSGGQGAFLNDEGDLTSGVNPGTIGSPIAARCLADPALATRVAQRGALVLDQSELQGVTSFERGNPALAAETADTWTFGGVLRPNWVSWLEPATLSVDYYNIKVKSAIRSFNEQLELNRCYLNGDPTFCSQIVRNNAGSHIGAIGQIFLEKFNVGELSTSGIDVQFNYRWQMPWSIPNLRGSPTLDANVTYSYLANWSLVPFAGADKENDTGELGLPRNRTNVDLTFRQGPLRLYWMANIIGRQRLENDVGSGEDGSVIGMRVFHNMQVSYDVTDTSTLLFGIDNVFNEYVFIGGTNGELGSSIVVTTPGHRTAPEIYSALGRQIYGGFRLRF